MSNPFNAVDFLAILPELILLVMGFVVLMFEMFGSGRDTRHLAYLTLLSLGVAGYAAISLLGTNLVGFWGTMVMDDFTIMFSLIFIIGTALVVLISMRYQEDRNLPIGEYYGLLLFSAGGMVIMASARDLLMIFVGLEILSISSYILAGIIQKDPRSNEAALKYFLLGAFATGFLLYGMVLIYGGTGSIHLHEIQQAMRSNPSNSYIWLGLALMLVGFGFKIALVPFHMWTPDVYEGAPTTITAFLSGGPKAAGFAAIIRILLEGLPLTSGQVTMAFWVIAALTMTVGNVLALRQNNIKRMLAYSSIAHAGYVLVAIIAGGANGIGAVMFYMLGYVFMNTGAFAILIMASDKAQERVTFEDFRGYGYIEPALALIMFVFMLSLAGIPLTAGFSGKFQIFRTAIAEGWIWLAIVGVLNSVISIYYYLRIVVVMYMQPAIPGQQAPKAAPSLPMYAALAVSVIGVVYLGIFPSDLLELTTSSAQSLLSLR